MKLKLALLFAFAVLSIGVFANLADAVVVSGFFGDDEAKTSINVAVNEQFNFQVTAFTLNPPLDIFAALYKVDQDGFIDLNNPVNVFYDYEYADDYFEQAYAYSLNQLGNYKLIITGKDNVFVNGEQLQNSVELTITVQGFKPAVDDISNYNENGVNSGLIDFKVDFHDVDGEITAIGFLQIVDQFGNTLASVPCEVPFTYTDSGDHYGYTFCPFDSRVIEYADNLTVSTYVLDNQGLTSEVYTEGPFTIDNRGGIGNKNPRIISTPNEATFVDGTYTYVVRAVDPDDDELEFAVYGPEGMSIINTFTDLLDGFAVKVWHAVISWIPTESDYNNFHDVEVEVEDNRGGFDSQEFRVPIGNVEPVEDDVEDVHEFSISKAFVQDDGKFLNVHVQLKNRGNQKEEVEINAFIMETGSRGVQRTTLNLGETDWQIVRILRPVAGDYLVRITAGSDDAQDLEYLEASL